MAVVRTVFRINKLAKPTLSVSKPLPLPNQHLLKD